jgi:Carboxypeptidase regulatory-like domain
LFVSRFVLGGFFLKIFLFCSSAGAQTSELLPDPPEPQEAGVAAIAQDQSSTSFHPGSTISGTVLDTNGDVIQGALVKLSSVAAPGILREIKSGATGQFVFTNIESGTYIVTVTAEGMTTFVSPPMNLRADEPMIVPRVVLGVAAATTSVMVMDEEQASKQQVQIAEQQRVLKVFPNFYSSYDWNAPPMLAKQKYQLAARTLIDPVTFLTTAGIAGAEQCKNVFPTFGSGIEGYGKRYGAAFASHGSAELLTRAVFPSMFHTDPRYFIMGKGSTQARAMHAVSSTWITRGDDGGRRINWPQILGGVSAAALSNAYFPAKERGVNLVLINGLGDLGGNMVDNLIREFLLNRITTRAQR